MTKWTPKIELFGRIASSRLMCCHLSEAAEIENQINESWKANCILEDNREILRLKIRLLNKGTQKRLTVGEKEDEEDTNHTKYKDKGNHMFAETNNAQTSMRRRRTTFNSFFFYLAGDRLVLVCCFLGTLCFDRIELTNFEIMTIKLIHSKILRNQPLTHFNWWSLNDLIIFLTYESW